MEAADRLRRDAEDIRALGSEHGIDGPYADIAELVLRLVADALDPPDDEFRDPSRQAA